MRKLLNRKIVDQDRKCPICHEDCTDYNDIVPDHRDPKGMAGGWKDDHPDDVQATHWWCNGEKKVQIGRLTADQSVEPRFRCVLPEVFNNLPRVVVLGVSQNVP
jgi:hypothetical protein